MVSQPEFGFDQFQLHDCEVPVIVPDHVYAAVGRCGMTRGYYSLSEFDLSGRRFIRMCRSSVIILDAKVAGLGDFPHRVSHAAVEEHERVLAVTQHALFERLQDERFVGQQLPHDRLAPVWGGDMAVMCRAATGASALRLITSLMFRASFKARYLSSRLLAACFSAFFG